MLKMPFVDYCLWQIIPTLMQHFILWAAADHTGCLILVPKGTAVAQWLRCCATNRKVAGSIPDGVTEIFHQHNPSDRIMALGLTQPLTEMSTMRISWG